MRRMRREDIKLFSALRACTTEVMFSCLFTAEDDKQGELPYACYARHYGFSGLDDDGLAGNNEEHK
jgi:hypothetical protein